MEPHVCNLIRTDARQGMAEFHREATRTLLGDLRANPQRRVVVNIEGLRRKQIEALEWDLVHDAGRRGITDHGRDADGRLWIELREWAPLLEDHDSTEPSTATRYPQAVADVRRRIAAGERVDEAQLLAAFEEAGPSSSAWNPRPAVRVSANQPDPRPIRLVWPGEED